MKFYFVVICIFCMFSNLFAQVKDAKIMCEQLKKKEIEYLNDYIVLNANFNIHHKELMLALREEFKNKDAVIQVLKTGQDGAGVRLVYTKRILINTGNNGDITNFDGTTFVYDVNILHKTLQDYATTIISDRTKTFAKKEVSFSTLSVQDTLRFILYGCEENQETPYLYDGEDVEGSVWVQDSGFERIILNKGYDMAKMPENKELKTLVKSRKFIHFIFLLARKISKKDNDYTKKVKTFISIDIQEAEKKNKPYIELTYTIDISDYYLKEWTEMNKVYEKMQLIRKVLKQENCK